MMGSSPRFNMYGNEFGMGKAVALCSGYANKFDGKVSSYPGYEGGGSIDLELKHVLKENLHYCVTRCKVALAHFLSRFFTEACVYLPFPFTACFLEDMIV